MSRTTATAVENQRPEESEHTTAAPEREQGQMRERAEREPEPERARCPECAGRIRPDSDRGERVCADCGLVSDGDEIDYGPEWRSFEGETSDRSRVGAPITERRHDKGLSTTIGWENRDAYGNTISGEKRAQLNRLRTWNERFTSKDARERNLKQALGELERMASALGLSEPCRETAAVIYRRAVEEELLPGRSIEAMTTASLYAAARQQGTPRTFSAFESVSRVDDESTKRAYRYLSSELELEIAPPEPEQYLRQFASDLAVSDETERLARDVLEAAKAEELHIGKSPAGLTAAAIYAAGRLTNDRVTQETIDETTGVSKFTVRNRYRELLEAYGIYDADEAGA
ncbi:transcription initiation factor IIB [Halobiforma nitratireducens]|uniref:Transcription initiation factor IIB n=1 Tax=Halobiforma nitratireducens JCM 10879 TaxID=1227454 RepID=M0MRP2_9EURY|nr:TFIIB-type zinc ribbon-containing protein [Halobiforma nitratireducens]EMA47125.1 transcription initiation factor IIB [Halobiforma nitratireducens JCM 10879]